MDAIVKKDGGLIVTCCKCELKHLWILKAKRGETAQDDFVEVEFHVLNDNPPKISTERQKQ